MFVIKHISETYSDPTSSVCEIGRFDGPSTSRGDLVFEREGITGSKTFMNSNVLRCLLFSNPGLLAASCGVVCSDLDDYNKLVQSHNDLLNENKKLKEEVERLSKKTRADVGGVK